MKLKGAQIIVETLIEQGASTVFGYPGGQVIDIYDALYLAQDRIHHIITAHEQGAAHAADGYARATGKVGVVIATSGPGATNLVTGIATAYLDSVEGDFISIVGPSGCGKSTLLDIIAGLMPSSAGQVFFLGEPVIKPRKEIGYMLQRDQLFEWRSILRNTLLGPEIQHSSHKDKRKARKTASEMLTRYDLGGFLGAKPSELSGGMRQRAALIRTLIMAPTLLLLDEPFSALDYQTRLTVCNDICEIIRTNKKTAILVTHDLAEAVSTGNRVLVLGKRPSTIKMELVFDPDFTALSPLARRNHPLFNPYFQKLWEAFAHEK